MKAALKRYPKLVNSALVVRQLVSRALATKKIDKYVDMEVAHENSAPADDAATALFLRSIMTGNHTSVVEIGCYDGSRIVALKKLAPGIDAHGVDILTNYQTRYERDGVAFGPFEDAAFERKMERPLVLSRGTLSYFDPVEVEHFFNLLHRNRISIAFYEPNPFFHVESHAIRYRKTNRVAHYHPYDDLLEALGYRLTVDKRTTYNWARSLYGLECLRFQYATI